MIPVDEFYDLPKSKQSHLVRNGQVVVDSEIASSIPDIQRSVHIFEESVDNKIIETLKQGHYKIEELVQEFPIKKRVIESIVSDLRHRPQQLLGNHQSVVRVADTDGTAYIYTIEPLTYEVRVWDPTLCWHLFGHNESIQIPEFPSDKTSWTSGREEFVDRTEKYWKLPESELPKKAYKGISFASSSLGPLLKSIPQDEPEVRERIQDTHDIYRRRKFDENNIKHTISYLKSLCRRNPSLAAFQSFVLYLYDLSKFIKIEEHREYRSLLQSGIKLFFACLFGGYRVRDATEWKLFEIDRVEKLDQFDKKIVDIVELQPTSNSKLSDRWDLPDGSAVQRKISGDLDQYATRNSDNYICATESACRYIRRLENEGMISFSKTPPEVPNQAKTVFS